MHVICILILLPFILIIHWSATNWNGYNFCEFEYDFGSHVLTTDFCAVGMLLSIIVLVNTRFQSTKQSNVISQF